MLSAAEIILEYVCPAAGMLCANWMFLAPLNDVRKAAQAGKLGDDLNPTPWAVMLGNTLGWVGYGLLRRNWFILFANAPGFFFSCYFNMTTIKLLYAASLQSNTEASVEMPAALSEHKDTDRSKAANDDNKTASTETIPSALLAEPPRSTLAAMTTSVNAAAVASATGNSTPSNPAPAAQRLQSHERLVLLLMLAWMGVLSCIVAARSWNDDLKQMVLGLTVNCNLVFFYGAPLSIIRRVLVTRSSRYLHGPTMLRNTANGVFWTAYGMAILDPYVAVPNGLGALLGVIQMALWVVFPRTKAKRQQDPSTEENGTATATEP